MKGANNFWTQLENKKITERTDIENYLTQKLGAPATELQQNLLFELTKKVHSYYTEEIKQSNITYSLLGFVSEIVEKKFKEGKITLEFYRGTLQAYTLQEEEIIQATSLFNQERLGLEELIGVELKDVEGYLEFTNRLTREAQIVK